MIQGQDFNCVVGNHLNDHLKVTQLVIICLYVKVIASFKVLLHGVLSVLDHCVGDSCLTVFQITLYCGSHTCITQ